jgi:hypothetical protein
MPRNVDVGGGIDIYLGAATMLDPQVLEGMSHSAAEGYEYEGCASRQQRMVVILTILLVCEGL